MDRQMDRWMDRHCATIRANLACASRANNIDADNVYRAIIMEQPLQSRWKSLRSKGSCDERSVVQTADLRTDPIDNHIASRVI